MNVNTAITVDSAEVDKFSRMAAEWWNETGTSGPLHRLNPARLRYIRDRVVGHFAIPPSPIGEREFRPFTGLTIIDVGCGGGIVCEPLARLGAQVIGIDASAAAIEVAKTHAIEAGLTIDYRPTSSDALGGEQFDIVLALEVVEHVADVTAFIASLKSLLKPNGLLILSTPNRTAKSFATVIIGAEYILRWLPRGTHDWRRFLKPSELARVLRANGLEINDVTGIVYDPLKKEFALSHSDVSVNYLVTCS